MLTISIWTDVDTDTRTPGHGGHQDTIIPLNQWEVIKYERGSKSLVDQSWRCETQRLMNSFSIFVSV